MKNSLIVFIFFPMMLIGQFNLVPNGSFEEGQITPGSGGSFYNFYINNWSNPNTASPDYFLLSNSPDLIYYMLPSNLKFVGIATYVIQEEIPAVYFDAREYFSCELLDSLIATKYYLVQYYARLAPGMSRCASNNLGVHFSDTALHADNIYYFDVDAQVKYFNNEIIEDTTQWTLVKGLYQAHGGERFLTLGNFNSDAETIRGIELIDGTISQTYFLVDEVSVIPLESIPGGLPVDAGPDQTIYIGKTAFIGQKISNMPSDWFELDGTPVAQNTAGMYVSPLETTTYVVTQTLNGVYSTDTVTVFVEGLGLEENQFGEWFIAPNPNKGTFAVQLKQAPTEQLNVFVLDSQGRKVVQETVPDFSKMCTLQTTLAPGVYFLQLSSGNKSSEMKRVVVE